MRVKAPGALPLFRSEMQVRLLGLLVLQPERRWTMGELVSTLDAPQASVHRELRRIEDAGLLIRDDSARPHRMTAATSNPVYAPLRELLSLTVAVEDDLRDAVDIPGVVAAAIHGSWAGGPRGPESDIDVVVLGEPDVKDLRRRMRGVAQRTGRRIDLTVFTTGEVRTLASQRRGFARHLLQDPITPLAGDVREVMQA